MNPLWSDGYICAHFATLAAHTAVGCMRSRSLDEPAGGAAIHIEGVLRMVVVRRAFSMVAAMLVTVAMGMAVGPAPVQAQCCVGDTSGSHGGYPSLIGNRLTNRQRIVYPLFTGTGIGVAGIDDQIA